MGELQKNRNRTWNRNARALGTRKQCRTGARERGMRRKIRGTRARGNEGPQERAPISDNYSIKLPINQQYWAPAYHSHTWNFGLPQVKGMYLYRIICWNKGTNFFNTPREFTRWRKKWRQKKVAKSSQNFVSKLVKNSCIDSCIVS